MSANMIDSDLPSPARRSLDYSEIADFFEFKGIPWSQLKELRRQPNFNKRAFVASLSKEDKKLYTKLVKAEREEQIEEDARGTI